MWGTIIMLVLTIVVFYFFAIRPQKKQERETAEMRNSISVGDEIITIGGIIGTVVIIKDDKMMIETGNDRSKLTILKSAVRTVLRDDEPATDSGEKPQ
ncbi:MAG: preprotein translocase subunit YajC [Clostridia bacterium]|nr:preprotein translocase subunit YajC [Clostridia bacterium]